MYLQRKRIKGWSYENECKKHGIDKSNIVFCGRGTKYGNPFSIKTYGIEQSLRLFEFYLEDNKELFKELKGKTLSCWCSEDNFNEGLCHCSIINNFLNKKY